MTKSINHLIFIGIILLIIFVFCIVPHKVKELKEKTEYTCLTKKKLRKYKGLENITDKEAENIIDSLRKYSELTYKLFCKEKMNDIIS